MSDQRLRELEREWREDHTNKDKAEQLLIELIRTQGIPLPPRELVGRLALSLLPMPHEGDANRDLLRMILESEIRNAAEEGSGLRVSPLLILERIYGYTHGNQQLVITRVKSNYSDRPDTHATGWCGYVEDRIGFEQEIFERWGGGIYSVRGQLNGVVRSAQLSLAGGSKPIQPPQQGGAT